MTEDELDRKMMALALRLGARGRPSPNPHVGAVVVRDGQVLATGYHYRAGEAHAEVDALAKLGFRAEGATLYVTLEPCNHFGRTGPCSEAVLASGVRRVVIGCEERQPGHGGGATRLREAGIEVVMGALREEAERLVCDFHKHALTGLPFVTLKAALTLDGRMASQTGDSRWITGEAARVHAHRMRDRHDAIMVGIGTVLADDPALTVRHVRGRDPLRVVLDSTLLTPPDSQLGKSAHVVPTLIFHAPGADSQRAEALRRLGFTLLEVPRGERGIDLWAVLRELGRRGVVRLMVEGGPTLHGALLDAGQVDWVALFVAPRILADPTAQPLAFARPRPTMSEALSLLRPSVRRLGDDLLVEGALQSESSRQALAPAPARSVARVQNNEG
jgi:diaminohydroxyphosphoribosylaminopyrimidine deaminase/5-amino-6-(5-phosphoribosylamino)uracil reductase